MTEHLPGVQEYYDTLDSLNAPTRVSGRVTVELELAGPGVFHSGILRSLEKACYINGFHRSDGAYYTTITPFVEEL